MVKKDTGAKERAVNAIIGHKLVCTACCRLVNYYNCEVPAIFRLALVHQRYMPTYRPADTVRHHGPFSNSRARETRLRPHIYIYIYFFLDPRNTENSIAKEEERNIYESFFFSFWKYFIRGDAKWSIIQFHKFYDLIVRYGSNVCSLIFFPLYK